MLGVCCVLYNICEMRKEEMDFDFDKVFEFFDDEMVLGNDVRLMVVV